MLNVLICGTPGTGKSTLVNKLKSHFKDCSFINLSKFAIDNKLTSNYDGTLDSHVLDEEKLLVALLPTLEENKFNIIESIHSDLFSNEIIDFVFVCRTENSILYDRLKTRDYSKVKLENNLQSEIFQIILDETKENFDECKIHELQNNEHSDIEKNVSKVVEMVNGKQV